MSLASILHAMSALDDRHAAPVHPSIDDESLEERLDLEARDERARWSEETRRSAIDEDSGLPKWGPL